MLPTSHQVFLAIAREGHLTRAARSLHRTQPAVSSQLKKLEEELGVQLFHRTAKGMVLTEAGTLYRRYVEQAATWLEDGRRALENLGSLAQGQLAIGAGATATTYLLPSVLRAYHERYPGIRLHVREQGSSAVAEAVRDGSLDLGVVTTPVDDDAGLAFSPWVDDELQLIVPPGGPLDRSESFDWADLEGVPLVLFEAGSAVRRLIDDAFRAAGVDPVIAMELRSIESIRQMVAQGIGAGFVSRHALPSGQGLRPRTGTPIYRVLSVCQRADREPSPAARAFRACMTEAGVVSPRRGSA